MVEQAFQEFMDIVLESFITDNNQVWWKLNGIERTLQLALGNRAPFFCFIWIPIDFAAFSTHALSGEKKQWKGKKVLEPNWGKARLSTPNEYTRPLCLGLVLVLAGDNRFFPSNEIRAATLSFAAGFPLQFWSIWEAEKSPDQLFEKLNLSCYFEDCFSAAD